MTVSFHLSPEDIAHLSGLSLGTRLVLFKALSTYLDDSFTDERHRQRAAAIIDHLRPTLPDSLQ